MIKVEGLYSYKAIAFIRSKSNERNTRLRIKDYFKLPMSLQQVQIVAESGFSVRTTIQKYFDEEISDENG